MRQATLSFSTRTNGQVMGVLYLDRKGLELRLADARLELRVAGEPPRMIPAALLERVVIRAETQLSSQVLCGLASLGVSIAVVGGRFGEKVALMHGPGSNDARARIAQCQLLNDEAAATVWAGRLVMSKLRAQRRLLEMAMKQRPDLRKPLWDGVSTIENVEKAAESASNRASLRGFEGAAAAAYFKAYGALFADSLGFTGRRRRPPTDPVNSCLSLAYTLLHSQAVQACHGAGLEPMVGIYHLPSHGRASLASDLIEPWRPRIDQWV
ncbi:MAG: CRISPR-associated endonuclease Cas1, partial [Woeseiaceae bacterium]|nr:CRISPR-associated endonuclease Cas1 [Woeseiaceae bacterium]